MYRAPAPAYTSAVPAVPCDVLLDLPGLEILGALAAAIGRPRISHRSLSSSTWHRIHRILGQNAVLNALTDLNNLTPLVLEIE